MPAVPVTAVSLSPNVAYDLSLGTTVDTSQGNSMPNNGRTMVIIQTGATPGTVSETIVAKDVLGRTVATYTILDSAGAALAASKTYLVLLSGSTVLGDTTTLTATNASTKLMVFQQST